MNNLEDELNEETKEPEEPTPLDRESILNPLNSKKKSYGVFGLILMAVAALLLLFLFNGKEKSKDGLQKDAVEFEPLSKREVVLPEAPLPLPKSTLSEDELAKRKQEEALKQTRLKSAIVVYGSSGGEKSNSVSVNESQADPSGKADGDPNSRFQQEVGNNSTPKAKASNLGSLDRIILEGKLLDAVLETAVNSDLPGMVRAIINHDVYAESGENILIPRGSRLVGQYNSQVAKGQSRVFIVWTRVIRPDGIEVALNSGATDPLGRAGIGGSINHHFWQIFGASTLLSIVGGGTANAGVNTSDAYNSASAYRQQVAQGFQNSSSSLLDGYINIPPTIEIKQGTPIKVFVARDLDFSEALASASTGFPVMIP
jgi:type IV secretion system protein VirB10